VYAAGAQAVSSRPLVCIRQALGEHYSSSEGPDLTVWFGRTALPATPPGSRESRDKAWGPVVSPCSGPWRQERTAATFWSSGGAMPAEPDLTHVAGRVDVTPLESGSTPQLRGQSERLQGLPARPELLTGGSWW
jgi:hypothetical protein